MTENGVLDSAVPVQPARAGLGASYWRLWTSAGLSSLADGTLKVALPLVAVGLTRSPALIAGLSFAFALPWLLFALPAGALADRLDRRRAMLGANLVRAAMLVLLVFAALAHLDSIWALYVVAFGVGTAETLYDTSAQSFVPQLVGRDHLSRANGRLFAVEQTTNQFVGPPLAGLVAGLGALVAFGTPVVLWLVAIGALLLVRGSFKLPRQTRTSIRVDIAEGLKFLWRQRILRTLAVMVGTFNFATNATGAVLVLYAVGRGSAMGLSTKDFGWLLATMAVGSLLGALVAKRVERWLGRSRAILVAFLLAAIGVGAPGLTTDPVPIGCAFFLGGLGVVLANVVVVSLRQRITPDRLLGRLNSSYRLLAWGTMPLGAAAGGALAQLLGLRTVFLVMGLVALSVLFGTLVVTDRAMDKAVAESAE